MEAETTSLPRQIFEELKRRRVIRVATLYVIALWPIIQIVDILSPAIGLPGIAMRYMLIAFVAGLPVVLILAWLYDLNRGGIVRATPEQGATGHPLIGRSAEITIISVLIVAIVALFYLDQRLTLEESAPAPAIANPAVPAPIPALPTLRAIAVLPFVTFSNRQEDELFSDGLTEELLNVLSRIKTLRVIARTTAFAYKGVNKNIQQIGAELNVDTILEGSVRRNDVDNTIRVTAQLIDTGSGAHLWSSTFDREFRDIFRIQDEIAAAVVTQLNLTLGQEESSRLITRSSAEPEALLAFGRGQAGLARRSNESLREAEQHFRAAIALDPRYLAAHAQLANVYALQADILPANAAPDDSRRLLDAAQQEVDKALAIDSDSDAAWAAQGLVHMLRAERDPTLKPEAVRALERAMALNPSHAMAHMWYGNLMADPRARLRYHRKAFELDPRSPVAGYNLATNLLEAGQEAEAMQVFSQLVEADPHYPGTYRLIGVINEFRGRLGEAIRNYEKAYAMQPQGDVAATLATLWTDVGDFERADAWHARARADIPPEQAIGLMWSEITSLVARGDRPGAEVLLAQIRDRIPEAPVEYLNKARAAYYLGEYEQAATAFESARRLDPDGWKTLHGELPEAAVELANSYQRLGRLDAASPLLDEIEQDLTRLIAESPRVDPLTWFVRAQVSAIRGENKRALMHLQRAVDEGWREYWRPEVDACFDSLIGDPAYLAMMLGLSTRMQLIREQIAYDADLDAPTKT